MKTVDTKSMILCALFTALIAVGAYITIPLPPVPITLQCNFAILAGLLLGAKRGSLSVLVYILLGLSGIPVFTGGGGIAYVLKPSFGYILGFAAAAWIAGKIVEKAERPSYKRVLFASFAGLLAVYLFGMLYYYLICTFYLGEQIMLGYLFVHFFLIFIPGDALLCLVMAAIAKQLIPLLRRA